MNSWPGLLRGLLRFAVLMALVTFPAGAADGVNGAAHAFRGDIVTVRGTKVLLFGITAPADGEQCSLETGSASCAEAAKAALAALVADGPISCSFVRKIGHCSYQGRCRGADGSDIGLMLLRKGWARADAEASDEYRAAEADAKAAKRGLWASEPS